MDNSSLITFRHMVPSSEMLGTISKEVSATLAGNPNIRDCSILVQSKIVRSVKHYYVRVKVVFSGGRTAVARNPKGGSTRLNAITAITSAFESLEVLLQPQASSVTPSVVTKSF